MKIYTKTGDKGTTSLVGGTRVAKTHQRLHCYGTIDELNSHIGLIADSIENKEIQTLLLSIQRNLFNIGSILACETPEILNKWGIVDEHIHILEKQIDIYTAELPPLQSFILPSGHPVASYCHIARTVCRRAEREIIFLSETIEVDSLLLIYVNRLSDFLFTLARKVLFDKNIPEILVK